MRYERIAEGKFIERSNRFVAKVEIDGKTETVHVKNTGRCRELLQTGATVYLEDFQGRMGSRKMRYSLVAVDKVTDRGVMTVNMDSQAPNKVTLEALKEGRIPLEGMGNLTLIRPETKYGDSRFDFYLEDDLGNRAFVEVKGVTLEYDGHASFPDAPTERGARHVRELASALNVASIVTAEQFADRVRTDDKNKKHKLLCIIANLADYSLGATKGGEITHFTQFDIDFNQQKSLLETRCSGALTRVYSAIVVEEPVTDNENEEEEP